MAVDKPITIDTNYNEDKLEIESPQLTEVEENIDVTEFVEDAEGKLQPADDIQVQMQEEFNSNLAEYLDEKDLELISSDLLGSIQDDKSSREDWESQYTKGLDLLGFKYEEATRPFRGASNATHPVLAESAVQFQSQAYKELLPSGGPVKTAIIGEKNEELEKQAQRVKEYMNFQITYVMKDYETETDQMLFYLPLAGSTFKKVYFDVMADRAKSEFVPAEDLIVPYGASYLEDAERVTHQIKINSIELKNKQIAGLYRDIDLRPFNMEDDVQDKYNQLEGVKSTSYTDDLYQILECHCYLDLPGYEDPEGRKIPYIVSIDEGSGKILSIYRNYVEADKKKSKKNYFVHYKFLPGMGFYGFGLIHMIGGLSRTATVALRQLLDAGTLSNLPAGFKARGFRIRDDDQPLQPGEFRDVDAPGGTIQGALMNLPYKGPDGTLFQLLGFCVDAAKRFVSVADSKIGDAQVNQNAPVGTTIALLERGTMVASGIHKRLHNAQKHELQLLADIFAEFTPPMYPYSVGNVNPMIKASDFDGRIDIFPVSDPSMFSQAQRIAMAQTELQIAQSAPDLHNLREAYKRMYTALRVENIDALLPPPAQPQPADPATENANSLRNVPLQVFPGQDHLAHIEAHRAFMTSALVKNNMQVLMVLQAHISDHISAMATEEIQMATQQQLQTFAQQGQQIDPATLQQIQVEAQRAISKRTAEITGRMVAEEAAYLQDVGVDPLVELKNRELDLRQADLIQRTQDDMADNELARDKLKQKDKIDREKVEISRERNAINMAKDMMKGL